MQSKALIRAAATLVAALATSLPSQAAPTLIGDTVSFLRAYPDTSTQYGPAIPSTTVAAGSADAVNWGINFTLNPEASSISFNFLVATGMIGTGPTFDGFVVTGIDAQVDALSILSNNTNFTVTSLVNTVHGFNISFSSPNNFTAPGSVVIGLQLHDPSASVVPEPASLLLVALGLPVLLLARGRRSDARPQGCNAA